VPTRVGIAFPASVELSPDVSRLYQHASVLNLRGLAMLGFLATAAVALVGTGRLVHDAVLPGAKPALAAS